MDLFVYDSEHRVFICRPCQQAVSHVYIDQHLRTQGLHKHHHHSSRLPEIRAFFNNYPDRLDSLTDLVIPTRPIPVIPQLLAPRPGYLCRSNPERCQKVFGSTERIQHHCRENHEWVNPRRRGRQPTHKAATLGDVRSNPWEAVFCQQFVSDGPMSLLFQVVVSTETETPQLAATSTSGTEQLFTDKKRQIQERLDAIERAEQAAVQDGDRTEVNPWLETVEWVRHLGPYEHQRAQLISLLELPSSDPDQEANADRHKAPAQKRKRTGPMAREDVNPGLKQLFKTEDAEPLKPGLEQLFKTTEHVLAIICPAFDELIRVGQHTMMEKVNWAVRFEVNRKERNRAERRPFQARLQLTTLARYRYVWKQLICYIVRSRTECQARDQLAKEAQEVTEGSSDDEFSSKSSGPQPVILPPRFQLSPLQQTCIKTLWQLCLDRLDSSGHSSSSSIDTNEPETFVLQPLHHALLQFLISLLDQRMPNDEFDNSLLSGLAVMGLRIDSGYVTAMDYTPKLSAVVKLARILVVQQAWEICSGRPPNDSRMVFDEVRDLVDRCMVIGEPTPMCRIFHHRTYGMKVRYTTTAGGKIDWSGQGKQSQLMYNGLVQFTKEQFETMVRGLIRECRKQLTEGLLRILPEANNSLGDLPLIPWDRLRDNPNCDTAGWNFTRDKRNSWPMNGAEWWLWGRIQSHPPLRQEFLRQHSQTGPQPFRKGGLQEWFLTLRRFKELLLLLVYMCGGQPPRGPELLSLKHTNTARSRRNVFIEDRLVVCVTEYHKGYSCGGSVKIIHRYLPREVGELLVYYVWLVLPFEQRVIVDVFSLEKLSPFLWGLDRDGVTDGPPSWKANGITELLRCESVRYMGADAKLSVGSYRHCSVALSRRFCGDQPIKEEDDEQDAEEQEEEETTWYSSKDCARDLQAGHGTHVAGMIYARGVHEMSGSTASIREQFRQESERWHANVLGLNPHVQDSTIRKRVAYAVSQEGLRRRREQSKILRSIDIHEPLHRLLGPKARFRGLQERAIQSIMNQDDPVVCVMGTGAGKSLLFTLPAFCQRDHTTVVVVPMITLRADMIRRCREDGISCHAWQGVPPSPSTQILFTTPEAVVTNTFQSYLYGLQRDGYLARVVIDECHLALDSTAQFRPQLQELGLLLKYRAQMVYLTATLPPEDEAELFERLLMTPSTGPLILRASTTRPNICYQVRLYDGSDASAVAFIRQERARCQAISGQVVVYCTTIRRVDALAAALGCAAYHSALFDQDREEVLQRLSAGETDIVVATSALGVGVDLPAIYAVIHTERPKKMRDYGQESGRGGRNGKACTATILCTAEERSTADWRQRPTPRRPMPVANGGQSQIQQFCRTDQCRRVILDQYMDGSIAGHRERVQCEADELACGVCERRQLQSAEAERAAAQEHCVPQERLRQREEWLEEIRQTSMTDQITLTEIRQLLAKWHGRCPICFARHSSGLDHTLAQCPVAPAFVVPEWKRIATSIKYDKYSGCWECGIPQGICSNFREHPKYANRYERIATRPGTCQYGGLLIPAVVALFAEGRGEAVDVVLGWMATAGVDMGESGEITDSAVGWLAKKLQWCSIETNMMVRVFCFLARVGVKPLPCS